MTDAKNIEVPFACFFTAITEADSLVGKQFECCVCMMVSFSSTLVRKLKATKYGAGVGLEMNVSIEDLGGYDSCYPVQIIRYSDYKREQSSKISQNFPSLVTCKKYGRTCISGKTGEEYAIFCCGNYLSNNSWFEYKCCLGRFVEASLSRKTTGHIAIILRLKGIHFLRTMECERKFLRAMSRMMTSRENADVVNPAAPKLNETQALEISEVIAVDDVISVKSKDDDDDEDMLSEVQKKVVKNKTSLKKAPVVHGTLVDKKVIFRDEKLYAILSEGKAFIDNQSAAIGVDNLYDLLVKYSDGMSMPKHCFSCAEKDAYFAKKEAGEAKPVIKTIHYIGDTTVSIKGKSEEVNSYLELMWDSSGKWRKYAKSKKAIAT